MFHQQRNDIRIIRKHSQSKIIQNVCHIRISKRHHTNKQNRNQRKNFKILFFIILIQKVKKIVSGRRVENRHGINQKHKKTDGQHSHVNFIVMILRQVFVSHQNQLRSVVFPQTEIRSYSHHQTNQKFIKSGQHVDFVQSLQRWIQKLIFNIQGINLQVE